MHIFSAGGPCPLRLPTWGSWLCRPPPCHPCVGIAEEKELWERRPNNFVSNDPTPKFTNSNSTPAKTKLYNKPKCLNILVLCGLDLCGLFFLISVVPDPVFPSFHSMSFVVNVNSKYKEKDSSGSGWKMDNAISASVCQDLVFCVFQIFS